MEKERNSSLIKSCAFQYGLSCCMLPNSISPTGGGGRAVVNAIVSAINEAEDRVVIGGDFNVSPDYETVKGLESMGYKRHAHDCLDHATGNCLRSTTPKTTIIRDTGSDHRGLKTTWSSLSTDNPILEAKGHRTGVDY